MERHEKRTVIDFTDVGIPEIPMVGRSDLTCAELGLPEHTHPSTMEICYLKKGKRVYNVDGRDYVMKGNDVFITYPDEKHGSGLNPHDKAFLFWIQVTLSKKKKPFLFLHPPQAAILKKRLRSLPHRYFFGNPQLQQMFEKIFHLYENRTSDLCRISIANVVTELLLTVIECADAQKERCFSEDIQRVVSRIQEHVEENFSIDQLAHDACLSTSRFKAKFREQTGMPPGEFITRTKIEAGKKMLLSGKHSVTDVAFNLGFSSSQYFAAVFKRITRQTPSSLKKV